MMDEELVTEGARLRLSCRITGHPRPRVNWFFNGHPLDSRRAKIGADSDAEKGEFWLDLPSLRRQDAGVYAVVAENCEGRVESRCHVKVAPIVEDAVPSPRRTPRASPIPFAPRFSGNFNEQLDVQVGDKVTFICTVHGYPRPQVNWHKDGVLLHSSDFVQISCELSESGDEHKLVMPYVTLEHSGEYLAEASNPIGSSDCCCAVTVSEAEVPPPPPPPPPPPQLQSPPHLPPQAIAVTAVRRRSSPPEFGSLFRDVFCRSGDRVTLECEIGAWPHPLISWCFNGQPIRDGDARFEIGERGQTYQLTVLRATRAESGRYSVTAENDSGIATCSGMLIVQGPGVDGDRTSRIIAAVSACSLDANNGGGDSLDSAGGVKTEWVVFHRNRPVSVGSNGSVHNNGGLGNGQHSNGVIGNGAANHARPWKP